MSYCQNCGTQSQQGVNFCSNCGNKIDQAAPQRQTPPSPPAQTIQPDKMGESILTAISGLTQGILGRKNYVMLITSQRLVFMELTGEDIKRLNQKAREDSKNSGDGFFKRMASGLKATLNTGSLFKGMDVNQVMRTYPSNVSVMAQNVKQLRIKSKGEDYFEMQVKASGYNEKFRFDSYAKEQNEALKNLLGNRYKSGMWFF